MRTDEVEALAQDAKAAGADGLLLAPVSYLPLNEEEVFQHFAAVSRATDLPLCIYNNPSTTKFTFSPTLVARLAELPNVCAVKMPLPANGDFVGELKKLCSLVPDDFLVGYSGDWGACSALLSGCDAWYSVVGGLLPSPAVALTKAAQSGNRKRAADIDASFAPLWGLFKAFGSYRVMHMMADILRLARIAPPRPILPLADELRPQLEEALSRLDQTHASR